MPSGDRATARLHRDWLRGVITATGIAPTTLAKQVRIAPSTLTRPLREGEEGTSTLHAGTIAKIVAYAGIEPPGVAGARAGQRPLRGAFREEAAPFEGADSGLAGAVRALIAGRNGAVPYTLKTRSLEAAGYLPGDVVVLDLNAVAEPGEVVCAQVYDWHGGTAETVWRLYDPPILLGAARDIAQRPKPLIVDHDRVVIKGVVVGMIRPSRAVA